MDPYGLLSCFITINNQQMNKQIYIYMVYHPKYDTIVSPLCVLVIIFILSFLFVNVWVCLVSHQIYLCLAKDGPMNILGPDNPMSSSSNKQQKKGKDGMGNAGKRKGMVKDWCVQQGTCV